MGFPALNPSHGAGNHQIRSGYFAHISTGRTAEYGTMATLGRFARSGHAALKMASGADAAAGDPMMDDALQLILADSPFLISGPVTLPDADFTDSTIGPNGATAAQLRQALSLSDPRFTGAGIKVGVLSDSFNTRGGPAARQAGGRVPPASQLAVLQDLASGGSDEGRAMLQIVHDIAPDATLAFYTAFNSEQDFANGILALAAAGCSVICDDVGYFDEPMFQNGIIAQAIEAVEAQGVVYLTAAGNSASNAYQTAWTPISGIYDGVFLTDALSFAGSLVQTITVGANSSYRVPLILEWDQPYGRATTRLEVLIFANGYLAGIGTSNSVNPWIGVALPGGATYQIAIENLSGPDPGLTKEIIENNGLPVTLGGANAGTVFGHGMTPEAITVGAVSTARTPAFGVSPALSETFSASGSGTQFLFDDFGNRFAEPEPLSPVAISGVDNIHTTIPGGLAIFTAPQPPRLASPALSC